MRHRTALLLLAAALLAGLGGLALAINTPALLWLDTTVADQFAPHRHGRRDVDADDLFAYIGRPIHVLIPAMVFGGVFALRNRSLRPLLAITGAIGAGVVGEQSLKAVITRTAATPELVYYAHSFPSGHVTGTVTLLGMVAVCLGAGRGKVWQWALALVVSAAIVSVAVLALFTGAHTFTDVIGGMLLGGGLVSLGAAWLTTRPANSLA